MFGRGVQNPAATSCSLRRERTTRRSSSSKNSLYRVWFGMFLPSKVAHDTPVESRYDLHSNTSSSFDAPRYPTTSSSQRGDDGRPTATFSSFVNSTLTLVWVQYPRR